MGRVGEASARGYAYARPSSRRSRARAREEFAGLDGKRYRPLDCGSLTEP